MLRYLLLVALLLIVFAFAVLKGGKPERYVASTYVGLFLAGLFYRLVSGGWSEDSYGGLQVYRFLCDLITLVFVWTIAIRFNRWWVLWVGSVQFLAVMAHLMRAMDLPIHPLVYAIMERWPSVLAILITGIGTLLYARRLDRTPSSI